MDKKGDIDPRSPWISFRAGGYFQFQPKALLRFGLALGLIFFLAWRIDPADLIAVIEAVLAQVI
jgi:hypothetical protein